ncbi:hypothetical protein WJ32_27120 [Burkholderia ubonensis]|uniref:Uncharacterized protein n=1 Tax=Burkholderia ubonensis TaxID=101571 RepID=A0A118HT87_9BURK|nr:hypothetical protein WJ32_27120 [Burkholderia ubonensis]KVG67219.1 hypothetical protein WJ33_25885 [Burkholderia ubonensis]
MTPFCGSASVSLDRPAGFHLSAPIGGAVLVLVSDGMQNPYQRRYKHVRSVAAEHRQRPPKLAGRWIGRRCGAHPGAIRRAPASCPRGLHAGPTAKSFMDVT